MWLGSVLSLGFGILLKSGERRRQGSAEPFLLVLCARRATVGWYIAAGEKNTVPLERCHIKIGPDDGRSGVVRRWIGRWTVRMERFFDLAQCASSLAMDSRTVGAVERKSLAWIAAGAITVFQFSPVFGCEGLEWSLDKP